MVTAQPNLKLTHKGRYAYRIITTYSGWGAPTITNHHWRAKGYNPTMYRGWVNPLAAPNPYKVSLKGWHKAMAKPSTKLVCLLAKA